MKMLIPTLLLAAIAVPASADQVKLEIDRSDIDLSTQEGRDQLDRRIDKAAREACGMNEIRTATRLPSRQARACVVEITARAKERFAIIQEEENKGG